MTVKTEKELKKTEAFRLRREALLSEDKKGSRSFSKLPSCLRALISRIGWH